MTEDTIDSKAFEKAALKSEAYRIRGLLGLLGARVLFAIARFVAAGNFQLVVAQIVVLALIATYELLTLRTIRSAQLKESQVAPARWLIDVIVESQIPTVALFLLLVSPWLSPYQVL